MLIIEEPEGESVKEEGKLEYINLIDGLYTQLKLHKDHFSNMQNKCRALSSTWFLAAIAGIGYLLAQHSRIESTFDILLAIMILCFCAGFGITLLWHMDIVLYKSFWLANVIELAKLERSNPWLPHTNINILIMQRSKAYGFYQGSSYIGMNALLVIIISVVAVLYFAPITVFKSLGIAGASCILIYSIAHFMLKIGGELEKISVEEFK
jgi:hypothetical protein